MEIHAPHKPVELAREARANIIAEVRDNQKELDGFQKAVPGLRQNQLIILNFIRDVLEHGNTKIKSLALGFNISQLQNTSWSTSQSVGALAYMPYFEVKKYAHVYQLQDEYQRAQSRTLDAVVSAMTAFSDGRDPDKMERAELEAERLRVQESISALTAQSQVGEGLTKAYTELLSGTKAGD